MIVKQIILNMKDGSQKIYEVADEQLQSFFDNVYDPLFDEIVGMEMKTLEKKNMRVRKER